SAEEVGESLDPKPLAASHGGGCTIAWEHVTFGYQEKTAVLNDVTLEVGAGQMLALVGPTGAGKSTLVSLIPRCFDPWSVWVLIDGQDLKDARLTRVRAVWWG